ncbi:hypothetical protein CHS0354_026119 [Potamilus streckersoni]|uniref:Uncharacterized protein n=1 Tax=Potamilus streckersoni TaxID=2493646 RepID=A0AAE0S1L1_9BIVA|nr:hypothetical protein CHS0354_026119 [Potamilus streckersoni]
MPSQKNTSVLFQHTGEHQDSQNPMCFDFDSWPMNLFWSVEVIRLESERVEYVWIDTITLLVLRLLHIALNFWKHLHRNFVCSLIYSSAAQFFDVYRLTRFVGQQRKLVRPMM